ncbi:hypothetical protein GCM10020367_54910 [Streptomyces sannanensis]|uniref:Uncharacterized protein n=1 Tax=Streptomyces sannanensis TaxID=285536 RepID=A0ABP6SIK4_9ACTN
MRLQALDTNRKHAEAEALGLIRRRYIDAALRKQYVNARELNGLGAILIEDLSDRGIRTAADFVGFSWGTAPNGRGSEVIWIRKAGGGRVHVNGIGPHRAQDLVRWRESCVARAEARAPKRLSHEDRRRVDEIVEQQRADLQRRYVAAGLTAALTRLAARRALAETLEQAETVDRESEARPAWQRAEYDAAVLAQQDARRAEPDAEYLRLTGKAGIPAEAKGASVSGRPMERAAVSSSGAEYPRLAGRAASTTEPSIVSEPGRAAEDEAAGRLGTEHLRLSGEAGEPTEVKTDPGRPGMVWWVPVLLFGNWARLDNGGAMGAPPSVQQTLAAMNLIVALVLLTMWGRRKWAWRRSRTALPMPRAARRAAWVWFFCVMAVGTYYA